jgi:hypothetical protein
MRRLSCTVHNYFVLFCKSINSVLPVVEMPFDAKSSLIDPILERGDGKSGFEPDKFRLMRCARFSRVDFAKLESDFKFQRVFGFNVLHIKARNNSITKSLR